jgi:hypothetical protein
MQKRDHSTSSNSEKKTNLHFPKIVESIFFKVETFLLSIL